MPFKDTRSVTVPDDDASLSVCTCAWFCGLIVMPNRLLSISLAVKSNVEIVRSKGLTWAAGCSVVVETSIGSKACSGGEDGISNSMTRLLGLSGGEEGGSLLSMLACKDRVGVGDE